MTERTVSSRDRQKALREDARFRLLGALDGNPDLSQRALAREIGISLGAVNALLNAMIETGLVRIGSSEAAAAQFRFAYDLTRAGRAERARLAGRFLARRRAEYAALGREIETLEAAYGQGGSPAT